MKSKTLITIIAVVVLLGAAGYLAANYIPGPVARDGTTRMYRNEKYGFQLAYPADHTAYTAVDLEKESLIPAGPDASFVAIAETEAHLFCCEVVVLSFDVVAREEGVTTRAWLDGNMDKYVPAEDVAEITDVDFVGAPAVRVTTRTGGIGSTYKLIVLTRPDHLIVINQNSPSQFLDDILETFELTGQN